MSLLYAATVEELGSKRAPNSKSAEIAQTHDGAVSWGAVASGPVKATALALILLILGVGVGLSFVSPWAHYGASAATVGVSAILWVTLKQILASALGLSGRPVANTLGCNRFRRGRRMLYTVPGGHGLPNIRSQYERFCARH